MLEENQALKGGQCGWRSQAGGSREYTTRLPHLYSGEEFGLHSKADEKPGKVSCRRMTGVNLHFK